MDRSGRTSWNDCRWKGQGPGQVPKRRNGDSALLLASKRVRQAVEDGKETTSELRPSTGGPTFPGSNKNLRPGEYLAEMKRLLETKKTGTVNPSPGYQSSADAHQVPMDIDCDGAGAPALVSDNAIRDSLVQDFAASPAPNQVAIEKSDASRSANRSPSQEEKREAVDTFPSLHGPSDGEVDGGPASFLVHFVDLSWNNERKRACVFLAQLHRTSGEALTYIL